MKSIYLVRHAKAGWPSPSMADFDRPLANRGHAEAESMSAHLARKGIAPELLVSSPARRTLETAEIFADALDIERREITQKIEIYEGSINALASVLQTVPDEVNTAMLFGHNPTISHFVQWLTGKPADAMETCGIAKIDLACDRWRDAAEGCGMLVWYVYPERE